MKMKVVLLGVLISMTMWSCQEANDTKNHDTDDKMDHKAAKKHSDDANFEWKVERFADIQVLRYKIPAFEQLTLKQKKYVYYLTQAGMSGRDIIYDTNYRHNLKIRKALETIIGSEKTNKTGDQWDALVTYAKRIWFANGIHHHYSMEKFEPGFNQAYLEGLLKAENISLSDDMLKAIFDSSYDAKKVSLDATKDLVQSSAINFYAPDITQAEAEAYYENLSKEDGDKPVAHGLNTRLVKENGVVKEQVWKLGGMYGDAIKEIITWLAMAKDVAENDSQAHGLGLLIKYYQTGDLKIWDDYNIAWATSTDGDIDYINSFIEVYNDPLGYKGSYESIVEINDFDASARMAVLSKNIQWFEDHAPIQEKHKKKNAKGVSYKVVTVAGEAGDASPATPIGVNLPNSNWIRSNHGSKSVSLGNIIHAYEKSSGGGMLGEFAHDQEEIDRIKKYGTLADKMGTALHEVLGHASGQIEEGVGTPKQTLKSYASTLEEARADIFSLYYITDPKIVELGLFESTEAGKAEYDSYIANGMMKQLRRLEPGAIIEESHMRNRQLIAQWAYEKGQKENVIEKVVRDGKTYFNINDYDKLRDLFGELLNELQRIKSQGDYEAGKNLVEDYGVQVDKAIHAEVIERSKSLNIAPYSGFVNPVIVPMKNDKGEITGFEITQPATFSSQMLDYANRYGFL